MCIRDRGTPEEQVGQGDFDAVALFQLVDQFAEVAGELDAGVGLLCRDIAVSYTHLDVYKRQVLHQIVSRRTIAEQRPRIPAQTRDLGQDRAAVHAVS